MLRRLCIIKLYNDHTKIQSTDKKHASGDRFTFILFIHKRKRHSRRRTMPWDRATLSKRVCSPVIVFLCSRCFRLCWSRWVQTPGRWVYTRSTSDSACATACPRRAGNSGPRSSLRSPRHRARSPRSPLDRRHVLHKHRRTARSLKTGTQSPVSLKHLYFCPIICSVIQHL